MLVDNVFVCYMQELFEYCTFNFTHCIPFAQLHCVFFQHITFLFMDIKNVEKKFKKFNIFLCN
jgi:hypothetical protein